MKIEFWINGGKHLTDKFAELELDYVPQLKDIVWFGEPNPIRYVVAYRDFHIKNRTMTATIILE